MKGDHSALQPACAFVIQYAPPLCFPDVSGCVRPVCLRGVVQEARPFRNSRSPPLSLKRGGTGAAEVVAPAILDISRKVAL